MVNDTYEIYNQLKEKKFSRILQVFKLKRYVQ